MFRNTTFSANRYKRDTDQALARLLLLLGIDPFGKMGQIEFLTTVAFNQSLITDDLQIEGSPFNLRYSRTKGLGIVEFSSLLDILQIYKQSKDANSTTLRFNRTPYPNNLRDAMRTIPFSSPLTTDNLPTSIMSTSMQENNLGTQSVYFKDIHLNLTNPSISFNRIVTLHARIYLIKANETAILIGSNDILCNPIGNCYIKSLIENDNHFFNQAYTTQIDPQDRIRIDLETVENPSNTILNLSRVLRSVDLNFLEIEPIALTE